MARHGHQQTSLTMQDEGVYDGGVLPTDGLSGSTAHDDAQENKIYVRVNVV